MQRRWQHRGAIILLVIACMIVSAAEAQTTLFNGVTVPGVVITHSPKSSGKYIGSPSIAILPDGSYVASHDFFGPNSGENSQGVSEVYRSTDQGQTWSLASHLVGQYWSGLFVHDNDLYICGTSKSNGNLVIRRSTDGGFTWTTPASSSTGLLKTATGTLGYHTSSMQLVEADGRLWRGFETRNPSNSNAINVGVMSIPLGADLLDTANWTFSNTILRQTSWLAGNSFTAWREGGMVVDRNGNVVNMVRVDLPTGYSPEYAAMVRVQNASTITFDSGSDLVQFPGGAKKFTVRYNATTDKYWTVSSIVNNDNYVSNRTPGAIRNIMALMSSDNLDSWTVEQIIVQDLSDVAKIGFQYMDWVFDGSDIVIASRTAYPDGLGGANTYHDANFLTFHRVVGVVPEPSVAMLLAPTLLALVSRRG
ncbi:MAG: exo-alpha-sialidase [Phycisphaeraceae bacterium]|nr:exo-alpha-sialidase [Phycisphaeraceae bacterium]